MILLLAAFLLFGSNLIGMAQEKEVVEKEMKVRKEFLEQDMEQIMQNKDFALQEMEIHLDELNDYMSDVEVIFEDGSLVIPNAPDKNVVFFSDEWAHFGQDSQTQLTLRNSFQGSSDSSTGTFDVEEGVKRIKCMISGKVRSGEIKISIKYPGGKSFKKMTINSSAEVTFSQTINFKNGDTTKYIGSWEYSIEAVKAEGNYMLQISTY